MLRTLVLLLAAASLSQASLVTSDPQIGTTTLWTTAGLNTDGAILASGFFVTSNGTVAYGNAPYSLGSNGTWQGMSWVGTGSEDSYIQINLGGPKSFVGAFMNYTPGAGNPIISAIAEDGVTVLESWDLSTFAAIIASGTNNGAFRGIYREQNDIYFFRLTGGFLVTSNLQVTVNPEPGTLGMAGAALAFLAIKAYRRRSNRP